MLRCDLRVDEYTAAIAALERPRAASAFA